LRLTYYGHAAFLVETADGTRIIIDPYLSGAFGGSFAYAPIDEPADLVVATHEHDDHGAVGTIPGHPRTFVHPVDQSFRGVRIVGIPAAHDPDGGRKRGLNTLIVVDDGRVRLVHLGDLGHELDRPTRTALERVDVLLIPVGGTYTIDAGQAARVVDSVAPKVVIPIHYRTSRVDMPLAPVDDFLELERAAGRVVVRTGTTSVSFGPDTLPAATEVYVLDHAR
jgi:L-ascorbate metabolism protein UlaG (beta-lactamase superfamily)